MAVDKGGPWSDLDRGWTRIRLIRDCAAGELTGKQLADKYSVSLPTIQRFKRRHAAEITDAATDIENELAAIWVNFKAARLAEYQQIVTDVNAEILRHIQQNLPMTRDEVALLKVKMHALHAIAEELGQLPPRTQVSFAGATITYEYPGVDPSTLK